MTGPRIMFDAVTVSSIPAGATMVAGYIDGHFANMPAMAARFPHAVHVPIAVFASTNDGLVLDVETGDATPAQAVGWVKMRRAAGVDPSVYCNSSTWPAVKAAFRAAGVAEPHYWIAQYDNVPTIPAGAVAKQHQNTPGYDVSVVAAYWPGVDPAPAMPPPPAPTPAPTATEETMQVPFKVADGGVHFARGSMSNVSFMADPSLYGKQPATVRVVVWYAPAVPYVTTVTLGSAESTIGFADHGDPAMVYAVTVTAPDFTPFTAYPAFGEVS